MKKATRSCDGEMRVTVRVEFRVPQVVVEWLLARVGRAAAEAEIRSLLQEYGNSGLDYRRFMVRDGVVDTCHYDDVELMAADGWDVCSL